MSLTEKEQSELVRLMYKVEFPTPFPVFEAWCKVFGVICVETVIIRNSINGPEIFLTYRNDKFFKGWHIPGCVHLPTEDHAATLNRVLSDEIKMDITTPKFFNWFERLSMVGIGNTRGYEFSLVFVSQLIGNARENDLEKFFPLHKLPEDLIFSHIEIIDAYFKARSKSN